MVGHRILAPVILVRVQASEPPLKLNTWRQVMTLKVWEKSIFDDYQSDPEELEVHGWTPPDRRGILYPETRWPVEAADEAAELFAEWFYGKDGWEVSWPVEIVVRDNRGDYFVVKVHLEMRPVFSAFPPVRLESAKPTG